MTNLVAEIGINYAYGNSREKFLEQAKALMMQAKLAGFDYVKFQKRTPQLCVPKDQAWKPKEVPWSKEPITYMQYKKDIEFSKEEYNEIFEYADEIGIGIFASVWDTESLEFMDHMQFAYNTPSIVKIPSALIVDDDLCKLARRRFNKLMISTGMSTEAEIEHCVDICNPDVIFHTNSTYPTPVDDMHLDYINHLKTKFPKCEIGYSGHEFGLDTTIATVAMGVKWIERHITMSHELWGTDQKASVEPVGMFKLVKGVRELERALGIPSERRVITKDEIEKSKTLRK